MTTNTEISNAAAALGRKGGSAKSEVKTTTARSNGAKGGRPRQEHSWWVGTIRYVLTPNPLEAFGAMRAYRLTAADDRSGLRTIDVTFDRNYGRTDGVVEDRQDWNGDTEGYSDPAWYSQAPASAKRILKRFYTR